MTAEIVQLRDFYLKKLTRDADKLKGELVKFAKQGAPVVEGADPYQGVVCPEGIEGLPSQFPDWDVG